jgi:hypothetical protein
MLVPWLAYALATWLREGTSSKETLVRRNSGRWQPAQVEKKVIHNPQRRMRTRQTNSPANWGTLWSSLLRHYATSRNVKAFIPDEVNEFFSLPNSSTRAIDLGTTQPPTREATNPNAIWVDSPENVEVLTFHKPINLLGLFILASGDDFMEL